MVEANEEGKQVEQEYGYHSYIQPGEYIAKLEGRRSEEHTSELQSR